jgi:alkylation response protein AidB-like acyl-CoA dehydrogenase
MLDRTSALSAATRVRDTVLAPQAQSNDKNARFSTEAVQALAESGLLGLTVPAALGGSEQGPRLFHEVVATLAEADPSVAMVYVMHICATACYVAGKDVAPQAKETLKAIAAGKHLTTLAFSEKGSRSHFWAPVSQAKKEGSDYVVNAFKSWVTSAVHADSYVLSTQVPGASGPTDTMLLWVGKNIPGMRSAGEWTAMGMRSNAAGPMSLEACKVPVTQALTPAGEGFKAMLEVVLPMFCLGSSATSLGLCRGATAHTIQHLKTARFEHLGATLGEALPNLRNNLAWMQIETDGLAARLADFCNHLETPGEATMLRVLQSKAAAAETAIAVTQMSMKTCGGAAFSKQVDVERYFRDAQASAVMAPTTDVLREFIGKALLGIPLF